MAGRKPLPTAVKVARGNPGKRALNEDEPQFELRLRRAPEHLSEAAKKQWYSVGRMLLKAGVLTEADATILEAFCVVYARWVDSEKQVTKIGSVVKNADGDLIRNPFLMVANRALEQLLKMMGEMGLSPSARSRLKSNLPAEQPSLADELFRLAKERATQAEGMELEAWGIERIEAAPLSGADAD